MNLRGYFENDGDQEPRREGAGGTGNPERSRASLQTAALALSIGCVMTFLIIYISVPLGALAIILALLSGGKEGGPGRSRTAVTLAAAGMTVSTVITGYAFYRVTTDPVLNSQMRQMLSYYTYAYLGESPAEALPWLFKGEHEAGSGQEEEPAPGLPGQSQETQQSQPQQTQDQDHSREKDTQPVWSDDLLKDHDRLMEYFLAPQGEGSRGGSVSGSDAAGGNENEGNTYHPGPFPNEGPQTDNAAGSGSDTSSAADGGSFT